MFTAADIGWAVGHSYGVYGPLIHGMQTVLYEGLPIRPDGGIWWRIVEKYRVAVMFTSPTAIRVLKRQDPEYLRKYDTSSLERLYLAGEPLDEPTWEWIGSALKIPILDNYWQTETGWPVLALLPGVEALQIRAGTMQRSSIPPLVGEKSSPRWCSSLERSRALLRSTSFVLCPRLDRARSFGALFTQLQKAKISET